MRITLTIHDDIAARIRKELALGERSMKAVVNDALRRGLDLSPTMRPQPFLPPIHSSPFVAGVDHGRLNQLADELEAEAFLRHAGRAPARRDS